MKNSPAREIKSIAIHSFAAMVLAVLIRKVDQHVAIKILFAVKVTDVVLLIQSAVSA